MTTHLSWGINEYSWGDPRHPHEGAGANRHYLERKYIP